MTDKTELAHASSLDSFDARGTTESLVDAWKFLVSQYPAHVIQKEGPVRTLFSNEDNAFLNVVCIDTPISDSSAFADALGIACAKMQTCRHRSMLVTISGWTPSESDAVLEQGGFAPAMEIWGMAATSLAEPRRPERSLDWRLVNDARTSIDIGLINAAAYAMPQVQFAVSHNVHEWSGECYGIVGYDGEMPVTASLAFIRDRQIYVGWVATLPDRHGQGLGEAAMRRSIAAAQEAAQRPLPIWLHATEAGRPLYRSMGFEDAGQTTFHTLTAAAGNSE